MARYIDSEILLKKLFPYGMLNDGNYGINAKAVKTAVENTPTADAVEVVRCKDCAFAEKQIDWRHIYICLRIDRFVRSIDFCSFGERREKEE